MKYRLIALDLDGTSLDKNNDIPDNLISTLRDLIEHGVIVVIATGRMTVTAKHYADLISDKVYIVSYNGSVISMPDGTEISETIDPSTIGRVVSYCKEKNIYVQSYDGDVIFAEKYCEELKREPDLTYAKYREVGDMRSFKLGPSPKLLIVEFDEKITEHLKELQKLFPELYITQSNSDLIEVMPLKVNKAKAIEKICKKAGIPMNETIAVGDSMNDAPMIESAGIGAAVGNAVPELKAVADYVAKNERSGGAQEIIETFFTK